MLRHTPANGFPSLNVTSRISPGRILSGLERAKSRCRAPVGSRIERWDLLTSAMGSGKRLRVEGGGGYVFMGRLRTGTVSWN